MVLVLVLGSDFDVSSVSLILMGPPLIRTLLIPWSLDLFIINYKLYSVVVVGYRNSRNHLGLRVSSFAGTSRGNG